jgi:hypothetical protein
MSAAFYIVLERPIKGFDHFVNGKALARAGEILDTLARKSGTDPLMTFWSADPEELSEIGAGLGVTVKNTAKPLRPEPWFSAAEGLITIHGLRAVAKAEKISDLNTILADLDEFERVLNAAKEHGVGWHLAVDF